MKSTIAKLKSKNVQPYPKLMIDKNDGHIILFTAKDVGATVHKGSSVHEVGYFSDSWGGNLFTDFHDSVTLSNE